MSELSDATIAKLEQVWTSIADLGDGLTEEQWKRATDCPGWTVQDQVSHLVGFEATMAGHPPPEHTAPEQPWVHNPIGKANEDVVDVRRARPGAEVLAEWRAMTAERLAQLRAMTDDDFAADSWTPVGPGTVLDFLQIRIMDAWVHEQDMRRALDRPGHLDGPVAEHSIDRLLRTVPMVIGKRAKAPEGTTVVLDLAPRGAAGGEGGEGGAGGAGVRRHVVFAVVDGRAKALDEAAAAAVGTPTVGLAMDAETFLVLTCGRRDPEAALAAGDVAISGDEALGGAIATQLNTMI